MSTVTVHLYLVTHHRQHHDKNKHFEKVKLDDARILRASVEVVDVIPWDISGDHIYRMKCTEEDWTTKYEDGRWFNLSTSSR